MLDIVCTCLHVFVVSERPVHLSAWFNKSCLWRPQLTGACSGARVSPDFRVGFPMEFTRDAANKMSRPFVCTYSNSHSAITLLFLPLLGHQLTFGSFAQALVFYVAFFCCNWLSLEEEAPRIINVRIISDARKSF